MALNAEHEMPHPGILSRYVKLQSGAIAHYYTAGENGPTVMLLHGSNVGSSGLAGWSKTIPWLAAQGFRVYAPDRPGFGFHDTRPGFRMSRGMLDQVRYLHEFVEAMNFEEQFFLAGNSGGMQTGGSYALEYPERIKRMVLIATPRFHPRMKLEHPDPARRGQELRGGEGQPGRNTQQEVSVEHMRNSLGAMILNKGALSDDLLEMRVYAANLQRESNAEQSEYTRRELMDPNLFQRVDVRGRMEHLTIPTIVIWGEDDYTAPVQMGYDLEKVWTNFKFYYPVTCGHQAQTDRPDLVHRMFLEWFRDEKISPETEALVNTPEPSLVEAQKAAVAARAAAGAAR